MSLSQHHSSVLSNTFWSPAWAAVLTCYHWTLAEVGAHAVQEAKEEAEYLGRQMHEKWIKALTEIELLKASMISGHFLFEALMKAPLIVDNSPPAQDQTPAVAQEDMYL